MIRSILPGGRTAKSVGAYLRTLGDSFESLGLSFQKPLGNTDRRTLRVRRRRPLSFFRERCFNEEIFCFRFFFRLNIFYELLSIYLSIKEKVIFANQVNRQKNISRDRSLDIHVLTTQY